MNIFHLISQVYKLIHAIIYTFKNLPRDIAALKLFSNVKKKLANIDTTQLNVSDYYSRWLRVQPNKACIVFNETTWTFRDLENYGNKMANLFKKQGLRKGDVVALFMDNKPQYIGIWFGLSKLGVITACINTNLRLNTLVHSIVVARPKVLIYSSELEEAVDEVSKELPKELIKIVEGEVSRPNRVKEMSASVEDMLSSAIDDGSVEEKMPPVGRVEELSVLLESMSTEFIAEEKVTSSDVLMYIYTSGTTGMPKPAIIKHSRFIGGGFTFFDCAKLNTNDVFLVTLPIYHSNAGVLGVGAALISGATIVLRKKFSATNFWKECIQYKVTAFSYVGEVCRYLVNQPESKLDRAHSVRLCIGNGTRANIHKEFTNRFGVKLIEIYGATEGNCILVNVTGKLGACGFLPRVNRYFKFLQTFIIKVDENMEPLRDAEGFCVHSDPGEKGLVVGLINPKVTQYQYSGYANQAEASEKKIIKNLFKPGQIGFNTGDMVLYDNDGYIYFADRLGDTFRWRGENVSTVEVENAISSRLASKEVVVYGVEINGQEGKAGMATLMTLDVDIKQLGEDLIKDLPAYARPIFLRLSLNVEHTGSLKAQKSQLVKEGFNVNLFSDKTFYFDATTRSYVELTREAYDKIQNGSIRV